MENAHEHNRDAVIAAAYRYAAKPDDSRRSRDLIEAVRRLEAGTCPMKGIAGDAAWPVAIGCDLPIHEGREHEDKTYGKWRSRNG